MRRLMWVAILASLCMPKLASSQEQPLANPNAATPVFREPFTLRIRVDKNHYYEEHYDKRIPYVAEKDVYLFSGENFGVNLDIKGEDVVDVTYQSDVKKADVWFRFTQEKELIGGIGMMLVIENKMKRQLHMDALMTVRTKREFTKQALSPSTQVSATKSLGPIPSCNWF